MDQRITPFLLYRDVAAALDWLGRAFGFRETLRFTDDNGRVTHAEMDVGGGATVMLGGPDTYRTPKELGQITVGVHVLVDDVDRVVERARAAGGDVAREPADQEYGERNAVVLDPEGQQWWFATRLRAVTPEEWGATSAVGGSTS